MATAHIKLENKNILMGNCLSSERGDSVITHLLEVMAIMGISTQIKTDNGPAYSFSFVIEMYRTRRSGRKIEAIHG